MAGALAARVTDSVGAHGSGKLGDTVGVGTATGLLTGLAVGVGLGLLAVAATAAVIGTGGAALAVVGPGLMAAAEASAVLGTVSAAAGGAALGLQWDAADKQEKAKKIGAGCSCVKEGSHNVFIEGQAAARVQDQNSHGGAPKLAEGSATVIVNNKPLVRLGDKSTCGGVVVKACSKTVIGGPPSASGGSAPQSDAPSLMSRLMSGQLFADMKSSVNGMLDGDVASTLEVLNAVSTTTGIASAVAGLPAAGASLARTAAVGGAVTMTRATAFGAPVVGAGFYGSVKGSEAASDWAASKATNEKDRILYSGAAGFGGGLVGGVAAGAAAHGGMNRALARPSRMMTANAEPHATPAREPGFENAARGPEPARAPAPAAARAGGGNAAHAATTPEPAPPLPCPSCKGAAEAGAGAAAKRAPLSSAELTAQRERFINDPAYAKQVVDDYYRTGELPPGFEVQRVYRIDTRHGVKGFAPNPNRSYQTGHDFVHFSTSNEWEAGKLFLYSQRYEADPAVHVPGQRAVVAEATLYEVDAVGVRTSDVPSIRDNYPAYESPLLTPYVAEQGIVSQRRVAFTGEIVDVPNLPDEHPFWDWNHESNFPGKNGPWSGGGDHANLSFHDLQIVDAEGLARPSTPTWVENNRVEAPARTAQEPPARDLRGGAPNEMRELQPLEQRAPKAPDWDLAPMEPSGPRVEENAAPNAAAFTRSGADAAPNPIPVEPTTPLPASRPLELVAEPESIDLYRGGTRDGASGIAGTTNPADPVWLGDQKLANERYVALSGKPDIALDYAKNRLRNFESNEAYVQRVRVPKGSRVVDWRTERDPNGADVGKAAEVEFRVIGDVPKDAVVETWRVKRSPSYHDGPDPGGVYHPVDNPAGLWIIERVERPLECASCKGAGGAESASGIARAAGGQLAASAPRELPPLEFAPEPRAAGAAAAPKTPKAAAPPREVHPATAKVMAEHGLTPESKLYRVMDPQFLDMNSMTVSGNPKSCARVSDPYSPGVPNPRYRMIEEGFRSGDLTQEQFDQLAKIIPKTVPAEMNASRAGAGLNVAVKDPSSYAQDGMVKVSVKVQDVLNANGKIYPDVSAIAGGIKPLYVTFDGPIPFTLERP